MPKRTKKRALVIKSNKAILFFFYDFLSDLIFSEKLYDIV